MKKLFNALWAKLGKIYAWLETQITDFAQDFSENTRSLKVILNWVYCIFYLWLVWFGVTHYPDCVNTAIVSTSTLVGAIFTGYVLSKSYEKVKLKESYVPKPPKPVVPTPEENGASD